MQMNTGKPAGVILAGGQSRRMGVKRKAFLELGGRTLLARVIDILRPGVEPLLLSSETATDDFNDYGLPVIADLVPRFSGPLGGLYSALEHLSGAGFDGGLVLCPCDAPFVPDNLVQVLLDAGQDDRTKPVVVSYQGVLQPTFSLWQGSHLPLIREAVLDRGLGGLKQMLSLMPHTVVEWIPTEPSPFFNINTPADLEAATLWLDRTGA
ncbi:MAG: molybdenum cofactor guanylyltransferase [Xanthomonadales bacterium]|nr:molybdenum cofactor guanylyltransferase [Gammaproteobacteria bacterium]NNK03780.1 molybdenum cofactor guanylyltransferase [Xanthomonadales bacterium]